MRDTVLSKDNTTLIAATYKRPDIVNRLIASADPRINIVIVSLSDPAMITHAKNVFILEAPQMPLANALNRGTEVANFKFPNTRAYLLTDDDVIFTPETVLEAPVYDLLSRPDTGVVAISRIISNKIPKAFDIQSPFVYKGGGYLIRREVFNHIGGYTEDNSIDEWDICMKLFITGYKNYRTQRAYAYHKQGSGAGGYRQAVKEGKNIGSGHTWLKQYINGDVVNVSGYDYLEAKSKPNELARQLHKLNNEKIQKEQPLQR